MKNLLPLLLLLIISCNNESTTTESVTTATNPPELPTKTPDESDPAYSPAQPAAEPNAELQPDQEIDVTALLGSYVGMFEAEVYNENKRPSWSNKITISIDAIDGNLISGHSVVAGNKRPFEGRIEKTKYACKVEAAEPGDDRYDGVFQFSIDYANDQINGMWTANDDKLAVTQRSYKLDKRKFSYNPNNSIDGEWENYEIYNSYNEATNESEYLTSDVSAKNASVDKLTRADVENMHKGDLEVMRNAIYARHGYSFKNRKMRYVFNYVDWYMPVSTDIRAQLTDIEKENIALLKRYEQHAERYYDSFGR